MRSKMLCRFGAPLLALLVFVALGAAAYEQPLSPESVRDAYFLGRQTEQADAFLGRYSRTLSSWTKDLYISTVQLLTPYAQIVSKSRYDMANQNSVDVDQKYLGRALPVIVRVWFNFPSAYNSSFDRFDSLVRHTSISVSQARRLKPNSTSYTTLRSAKGWRDGLEVELTFDAKQLRPAPLRIAISSPNGQRAQAIFDLSRLK